MKRLFLIFFAILGVIFYIALQQKYDSPAVLESTGNEVQKVVVETELIVTPQPTLSSEWHHIEDGLDIKSISYPYNGETYGVQVVRVNPDYFQLKLDYNKAGKTIGEWSKGLQGLVINAGFFKEANAPVGLLYIDGQRLDDHRSSLNGTGLLSIDPNKISIIDLSLNDLPSEDKLLNVLQTFPMLISDGKVSADASLTKEDRRTAIGVDAEQNIYLITAEYSHLGLYKLAQLLHSSNIPFTEVLNLDGGGSTGIAISTDSYDKLITSQTLVPTVLIIEKRSGE